jgi:hypothetical protein
LQAIYRKGKRQSRGANAHTRTERERERERHLYVSPESRFPIRKSADQAYKETFLVIFDAAASCVKSSSPPPLARRARPKVALGLMQIRGPEASHCSCAASPPHAISKPNALNKERREEEPLKGLGEGGGGGPG